MNNIHKDLEALSYNLDWKEFEALAESSFSAFGFETKRNLRLKKPRAEIDLIAFKNGLAFAIDCKHWKRTVGPATMTRLSGRQAERARRLIDSKNYERVIPIILTWHDELLQILDNGVPIIPIHKISDFILNWEALADRILILSRS